MLTATPAGVPSLRRPPGGHALEDVRVTRPVLLDVREPWEYAIGDLPDSRLVPFAELERRLGEAPRDRPTRRHQPGGWHRRLGRTRISDRAMTAAGARLAPHF